MRKPKFKADAYEQDLEDHFEQLERYPAEVEQAKMTVLRKAAKATLATLKKDTTITLRINSDDLSRIKSIAHAKGLRYQTYLTHVIHQIVHRDHHS